MRVVLVSMPWHNLHQPCLPIGILRARAKDCAQPIEVFDYHGNLRWMDHLHQATAGHIGVEDYNQVATFGLYHGIGDWVFASALYDDPDWKVQALTDYLEHRTVDPGQFFRMRTHADDFVSEAVEEILSYSPDVVGFSTTYNQNVPSFAVARWIKLRRPDVTIVFGGGNCDGPMGAAIQRNFNFIDYVVRGEGEIAFAALLDRLANGGPYDTVDGLCWRDATGAPVINPMAETQVPMAIVPEPDYSQWASQFASSIAGASLQPELVIESSRGCWWGEKHHCTFCGLNGTAMAFRAKPADRVLVEIENLTRTVETLDVSMVDNIMDMSYFQTLLPAIAATNWDLRLHYELKANLGVHHLKDLAAAGVSHIQPGIESLSTRVLTLMQKGVHSAQNIQVLRDSEDHHLTVEWNYLYGFPGEKDEDYTSIIDQMPALVHLAPPVNVTRITLERFSPYFERPELGFLFRRPAAMYDHVYDLPPDEVADLVYLFDTDDRGIDDILGGSLQRAGARWKQLHGASSLTYRRLDDGGLEVIDRRAGWEHRTITFDPVEADVYLRLMTPRTEAGLHRYLREQDIDIPAADLASWLDLLLAAGLIFRDENRVVALATRVTMLRLDQSPVALRDW